MRAAFINTLIELAQKDKRILLLTGDMGFLIVEPFAEQFPTRFINVGVAEQNMIGIATGLAEAGFIPFVYSIAPFAALRPFEFIRNGPIYHHLPVRIVGVGQGVEYGLNGHSHFNLEDIGVLRTQPGLTIISPADDAQAKNSVEKIWEVPGPVYLRLSKESSNIPALNGDFELGHAQQIGSGPDVLIVSTGAITSAAIRAAYLLTQQGLQSTILVIASIAPAPVADLVAALTRFRCVFTVEAHYTTGGLGSLVAEVIAEHGLHIRLVRFGFDSILDKTLGSAAFLETTNGLSAEQIAARIQRVLKEKQSVSPQRHKSTKF